MFVGLEETRVYRPFVGGRLLDEFVGDAHPEDGHQPERWICSTVRASDGTGLARTTDGVLLASLLRRPLDILVKLIDSRTRLMIQVHPDARRARRFFDYPNGKSECWYVLDTRVVDGVQPYVFVGFKEHVTRAIWESVFERQDIPAMEDCLHRVPVRKGDAFYIPAGVPHAMGSGVFFAEVQEPSDITLRTERRSPDGRSMTPFDLHHGAGFEALFSCFDYDGASLKETIGRFCPPRSGDTVVDVPAFALRDVRFERSYVVDPNSYAIVIVLEGAEKGREFYLDEAHEFEGPGRILVCLGPGR